jgi:predicted nucleic acid-binding protein
MSAPSACVVDAGIVLKLVLLETYTLEVQAYFLRLGADVVAHAPDLLLTECSNVLWKQVRFQGYPVAQAECDQLDILGLAIQWTPTATLLPRALSLAMTHRITVYDACYLALAESLSLPLLTADQRLANSVHIPSVMILTPDVTFK